MNFVLLEEMLYTYARRPGTDLNPRLCHPDRPSLTNLTQRGKRCTSNAGSRRVYYYITYTRKISQEKTSQDNKILSAGLNITDHNCSAKLSRSATNLSPMHIVLAFGVKAGDRESED